MGAWVCALVVALSCSVGIVRPAAADSKPPAAQGLCEIEFFASSTLHDFSGDVVAQPFALTRHVDAGSGREWWDGSVEVEVAGMHTGIDRRDRNMRDMFDAVEHPRIVADFARVESETFAGARGGGEGALDFELTIRDVTRPVEAKVSHWVERPDGASFDAEFEVSLESFGLEVPPVLGLLRVDDVVSVRAHVTLELAPGAAGVSMTPS